MNRSPFLPSLFAAVLAFGIASGDTATDIKALTGAPTRIVWCQAVDKPDDTCAQGASFRLCGFDTEDNAGERFILPEVSSYHCPLLTPDGSRVVFSNRIDRMVYVVNWNGSNLRPVARGMASKVWADPQTGTEWVYMRSGEGRQQDPIVRCNLADPKITEVVWSKGATGHELVSWFQLSADGRRASDAFPWSSCGVAALPDGTWKQYESGCWPSIAPDDSYRFFTFLGTHVEVAMFDKDAANRRIVKVNGAAGINGQKVYHPRWSNDVRFLTVTGPGIGGHQAELYIGRFNEACTAVEQWAQVTRNGKGDFFGNAWIKQAPGPAPPAFTEPEIAQPAAAPVPLDGWPVDARALVFLWENSSKANQIVTADGKIGRTCRAMARGSAKYTRFHAMDLSGGAFMAQDVDAELLKACKMTNELSIEALITPANLQQTGPARIISFSSDISSRNFTLGQTGDKLVMRLRTPQTGANGTPPDAILCTLEAGKPHHVIVTCKPGLIVCYLNGKEAASTAAVQGDFTNWEPHRLLFGDEWNGGRDWAGSLEGIAIYSRAIEPPEARKHYDAFAPRLKSRKPAERLVVQAKLAATQPTPNPKALGSYRRALVEYTYDIEKVLDGKCDAKRIIVAHWVILDLRVVPNDKKTGSSYRLTLERFTDNPQLDSEYRAANADEVGLPVYYDVEDQVKMEAIAAR
ncbi:MAG TPA: LamG-like jellyroll fold domain-containing protein, partial [Planctomycetota bacterium]|nr:LamG-like jellyroll fold domain-containing protein [Planctomycetota bacterium]